MSDNLSELPLLSELLWPSSFLSKDAIFSSVSSKYSDDDDTDYVGNKGGRQDAKMELRSISKRYC